MAIKKQEYYEGAALHQIVSTSGACKIEKVGDFFVFENTIAVYLKYSTKTRSPWGFTITGTEIRSLRARRGPLFIGLICGHDGVAVIGVQDLIAISPPPLLQGPQMHVSCARQHRTHYRVSGPEGEVDRKIAPSEWPRLLVDMSAQRSDS